MRSATNRVPVLARLLPCALAFGCAALLGLPTTASAGSILGFSYTDNSNFVQAAFSGDTATLTTHQTTPTTSNSFPVVISSLGGLPISPTAAFETFVGVISGSSTPQTGDLKGGFSGEIIISVGPDGSGPNFLTTTFSGGSLRVDGSSGSLAASEPLNTVTFTTQNPLVEAAFGGGTTGTGAFALSFAGITPPQSVPFVDFKGQNSGVFSTLVSVPPQIPEPASMVMALWAVPLWAVLGMLGYRPLRHRYKSSKA